MAGLGVVGFAWDEGSLLLDFPPPLLVVQHRPVLAAISMVVLAWRTNVIPALDLGELILVPPRLVSAPFPHAPDCSSTQVRLFFLDALFEIGEVVLDIGRRAVLFEGLLYLLRRLVISGVD